ncbi:MAG TPA: class I SAM-dependent methyltransferase [Alphaproteobacteria bacterium]|nr:class I SAM-dependent methyltransferase [Alphaproteobacteria bacterium]HAJ48379.1 class I SAM-dependent methyltransferase [Alphaproteobacteria bacterium]
MTSSAIEQQRPKPRRSSQKAQPRVYSDLAGWYHLLTDPREYKEEAKFIREQLGFRGRVKPAVLELGSGGGANALHLKKHFKMTLTDLSADMLRISRNINPDLTHIQGDMRSLRLNEQFDAVLIHDAIMYITSAADLARVAQTAAVHCKPGGKLIILPDFLEETFKPLCATGGNKLNGRSLRYVETLKRKGASNKVHVRFTMALTDHDRSQVVVDDHIVGLFSRKVWAHTLHAAGFSCKRVKCPWKREVFVCEFAGPQS